MTRRLQLLVGLAAGSALGASTTLLLVDREPAQAEPEPLRVVEDVDFTIHHDAPDAVAGDYRVEKVVCDVDTLTAHAYCSEGDE